MTVGHTKILVGIGESSDWKQICINLVSIIGQILLDYPDSDNDE